ncbi:MAG: hypothetical protein NW208_06580 [Bryobacter sp.]|nr:hypothetical protein [Bryobacter sp.]
MRVLGITLVLAFALMLPAATLPDPSPAEIQQIIQRFAAKESEFAKARESYIYKQATRMHEFDSGRSRIIGRFEMNADWAFAEGKRVERVTWAPPNSLKNLLLEPEDLEDMRNTLPFVLTLEELDQYQVDYLGHEQVDEVPCYVFSIKPKVIRRGQRYFSGIAWVDDTDLQIVKTYGRPMGIKRNANSQYPKFETYREQIDGKYWFPTYTSSEDTLVFENSTVPIKLTIRYQDYKRFGAESAITFGEVVDEKKPDDKTGTKPDTNPSIEPPKPPSPPQP